MSAIVNMQRNETRRPRSPATRTNRAERRRRADRGVSCASLPVYNNDHWFSVKTLTFSMEFGSPADWK